MESFINVLLAVLALALGIVAIGGNTWLKKPEPVYKRITFRGWIAISLLIATCGLSILKEYRASAKARELENSSKEFQSKLDASQKIIKQQNDKITSLQNEANTRLRGQRSLITSTGLDLRQRENSTILRVHAEDKIEYNLFGPGFDDLVSEFFSSREPPGLYMEIGVTRYYLNLGGGSFVVFGDADRLMNVLVINESKRQGLAIKISLYSTRDISQFSN